MLPDKGESALEGEDRAPCELRALGCGLRASRLHFCLDMEESVFRGERHPSDTG